MVAVGILLGQLVLLHTVTVTGSFVNIAIGKPVAASSIYDGFSANTGVDGNTVANDWKPNKIIFVQGQPAWWSVDLQREVQSPTVRIYFRTDYTYRRNGVKLYTNINPFSSYPEGQLCKEFISNLNGTDIADVYNVTCPGRWHYLLFYTNTSNDGKWPALELGEVEVYACADNLYGPDCSLLCSDRKCINVSSPCNHVTGQCVGGCQAGYRSTVDCTEPCQNFYGSGCNSSCSGRNCLNTSSSCDHVTGQCVGGCKDGYMNTTDCTEKCETGFYGYNCSLSCTDRNCIDVTSGCNHVTGQCLGGCKPGYKGTDCTQTCSQGKTYGVNCEMSCLSRHCGNSSICNPQTGQCPGGCDPGWRGLDCTERALYETECPSGFFGPGCNTSCGRCSSGPTCDHVTGNCLRGCKAGWRNEKCDSVCIYGSYGLGCTEKCGKCDGVCDSVDGRCPAGCQDGYNGTKCDVTVPTPRNDLGHRMLPVVIIAVVAVGCTLLLVGAVLLFLFRTRRIKCVKDLQSTPVFVSPDTNQRGATVGHQTDFADSQCRQPPSHYEELVLETCDELQHYDIIKHGQVHDREIVEQNIYENA